MAFANPKSLINELHIGEEMKVLDIGAGSGAYALLAAHAAHHGKVYAVDVQKELLKKLKTEAAHQHLTNIETIWADAEELHSTKVMDHHIDRVIVSNTLFQVEHKDGLAKEVARVLRPKGQLLVVDWTDSFGGLGPHPNEVYGATAAKNLFIRQGFTLLKEGSGGDHHYALLFAKN
jgi:ubiquinone/menaquinone biosynthesis C-methylase UbiE